jgi:hypothetical protein
MTVSNWNLLLFACLAWAVQGCAEERIVVAPPAYTIVHDRFVVGDKAWSFPSGGFRKGPRAIGARKIAAVLPTWAWVDDVPLGEGTAEARQKLLFETFLKSGMTKFDFFFEIRGDAREYGEVLHEVIVPAPSPADDAWREQAKREWLCQPATGSELVNSGRDRSSVGRSFNTFVIGTHSVEQELLTPKRNPPSGADIEISWAPWFAERLKDPDWLVSLWSVPGERPQTKTKNFGGHTVLWHREEKRPTYIAWMSGDKVISIGGSSRIIDEVLALYLAKYPSDLPKNYEFDPQRWLINVLERWRGPMATAIDEPAWGMRDQFAWWVWDDALADQYAYWVPRFQDERPSGKEDEQKYSLVTRDDYEAMMKKYFEEYIWGPNPAEPRLDVQGYQAAVVAWRRHYLDVKVPAVIERLRKHGLKYDKDEKQWRFEDQ